MITLELERTTFANLRALVIEGAKARDTGDVGIMMAAQLLILLKQAEERANQCQTLPS